MFGDPQRPPLRKLVIKNCRAEYFEKVLSRDFCESVLSSCAGCVMIVVLIMLDVDLDSFLWILASGLVVVGVALMWNNAVYLTKIVVHTESGRIDIQGDHNDHAWKVFVGEIMAGSDRAAVASSELLPKI